MEQGYSNAQGYGIFCGKKCIAKKKAQGIPPKRGRKNIASWTEEQTALARAQGQQEGASSSDSGGSSNAPLIIGGVLVLGIVATILIVKMRK